MAGEGETQRKMGIVLNFDNLLGENNDPIPELQIQDAAEMVEDVDQVESYHISLSDKELDDKIERHRKFLLMGRSLPDDGEKLKAILKKMEAEREKRQLHKDDGKRKRVKTSLDESTCNGVTTELSHPEAPSSECASEFSLLFCSKLETEERATKSFEEELDTLNRPDHTKNRKQPFSAQIKQNKVLSSRQAPFKSPSYLSKNIDCQQLTSDKQQGIHVYNASSHPSDKDASCWSSKKESGATGQLPFNSRTKSRETAVLVELEEHEVDIVIEADQVGQSSKKARIYYPSRDDPAAIEICYSDMECLAPESFLSSPIMNFYIWYLQKPISPNARRKHDYHIFNTYVYEKLKQDVLTKTDREASFSKFRRWWKGVNVFEKAYIFLPIHESVHWSLVIICMPDKEDESGPIILHLDSLGLHSSKSIFRNVKSFLIEEWKFLRQEVLPEPPIAHNIWNKLSRSIDEKVIEVPRQRNEYDCGIFVLYYIERFLKEVPERLKKQHLEMFGRQWFRPEEASSLRRKIRNLLRQEFKYANESICEVDS